MQLLETIRFSSGSFSNLPYHQKRMNNSRKLLFNCGDEINLQVVLANQIGKLQTTELTKCRVVYDTEIRSIEFVNYSIPNINLLKMIVCDDILYNHKYANRDKINILLAQKEKADDIIIIKNGLITDSSFANLLFFNGSHWLTPAQPLLNGTQRSKLLEQEQIVTADIRPADLTNFTKVRLINAMLKFEDEVDVIIDNVY
ncbi:MAG: aminotransferase class IV [Bacteroidota bacterium]